MRSIVLFVLFLVIACPTGAVLTVYTDEAAYLSDLAGLGYRNVFESFEDDLVWGSVRSTISDPNYAPVIISQGITWTSNHAENQITTSTGPALTGLWGFYSMPHGNFSTGTGCDLPGMCGDGFMGTRADTIYAVGGWVTGTFGGKLNLILDGDTLNAIDFQGENLLSNTHQFFGAIETNGFITFEYREMEGTAEDQKFMWADDFNFGLPLSSAVLITSFTAGVTDNGVELAWQISADEPIIGLRIYRRNSATGDVVSLPDGGLLLPSAESFTDTEVLPGGEYIYSLAVVRPDGSEVGSLEMKVMIEIAPACLYQNFPNPFNPHTTIRYYVDSDAHVSLRIYDVGGRHVRTLADRRLTTGEYVDRWDGRDMAGNPTVSGIYFYRLRVGKTVLTRKMVLLK